MSVRVEVKTVNKNNPDKVSYSRVKDILRFEPLVRGMWSRNGDNVP